MRFHSPLLSRRASILFGLLLLLLLSACSLGNQEVGEDVYELINQASPDQAIDVVFFPDDDYGDMSILANRQAFIDDISELINNGYYQNNAIYENTLYYNFWYMTLSGDVAAPANPSDCPIVTWPNTNQAAFAEVIMLLHPNQLRDCAWGNKVTSEPSSYRTVVHETSHAAFNLPDEYCCDGGYWSISPILYSNEAACLNDAANAAWRDCDSFTETGGRVWWRSENTDCDIMSCSVDQIVYEYGQGDWVVVRNVLDGLSASIVNDPIVLAPASWDSP
jgi:hypothetical protein